MLEISWLQLAIKVSEKIYMGPHRFGHYTHNIKWGNTRTKALCKNYIVFLVSGVGEGGLTLKISCILKRYTIPLLNLVQRHIIHWLNQNQKVHY